MQYTLKQAAEAAGRSKPTVHEAIKKGKLSATKDAHGRYLIEAAELRRVWPVTVGQKTEPNGAEHGFITQDQAKIRELEARLELTQQLLQQVSGERDRLTVLLAAPPAKKRPEPAKAGNPWFWWLK